MTDALNAHIRGEAIASGVINAIINGLIIWSLKKDSGPIPFSGDEGFSIDIVITSFLLLLLVAVIVIAIQRKKLSKGELATFEWDTYRTSHRMMSRFPRSVWASGILFGLFGIFVVAPITLAPMALFGVTQMTPLAYIIFKALWTGCLAALMIRPIILVALGENSSKK